MIFLGQASNYSSGQILRHTFACGGPKHSLALRRQLAQRYGADPEAVSLFHTGRSALTSAIRALAPEGSSVILPGLTCIAVVRAIRAAGCHPVFVDIDPKTLQYDWKSLDKTLKVCYNVSMIVAQNTLGLPLEMSLLEEFADKHHLLILEDLAHSAGRFYPDGREVGTVGAATVLSFGKGKAIDTIEGGALILRQTKVPGKPENSSPLPKPTKLPRMSDRLRDRWYPFFGLMIRAGYHFGCLGKVITAALIKLHWIARSADAELDPSRRLTHWQAKLALRQLGTLPRTPLREHFLVHDRDRLLSELEKQGFYLREIWYDTPVSPARYAEEADFPSSECPHTVRVSAEIVNLPTWYAPEQLQPARDLIKPYLQKSVSTIKESHRE